MANESESTERPAGPQLIVDEVGVTALRRLLEPYRMEVHEVLSTESIPGSYWGDPEAGLIDRRLYVRSDTPVQSALHEACHYICMTPDRRQGLHTDAGGGYDEEDAVCYLQILLADRLAGMGRRRMWADMDHWGYTFRLGSARAWFEGDAEDARFWLLREGLVDRENRPLGTLRGECADRGGL